MHDMFIDQDQFLSGATTLNEEQVKTKICDWAAQRFSFTSEECMTAMKSSDNEMYTRTAWKYAAENRVTGTPTFWINGVVASAPFDQYDWDDFLNEWVRGTTA